ncbi:TrbM/KikA/MpfK family conjugal transfer protein [Providencia rettgeri]
MKNMISVIGLSLLPLMSYADAPVFTGDTKLACEAILCLSSSTRPSECAPSLARYFGINKEFWSDTVRARRNFLDLCPASSEKGMPDLVSAIVNGAGRCDAAYLNKKLYEEKKEQRCSGSGKDPSCWFDTYYRIKNELPNYCQIYVNHEWTDLNSSLHYEGSSEWIKKGSSQDWNHLSGKWVD